ncbi:GTP cyclohydrolase IIa [Promicromonospora iranensis]|jgi:GTP cyclohydrolase III|uniref:GTP cyclohydrolase III n=1 Tax=Promicromonospora iranensis TaxID=1105144 RepID=A0ABU2CK83_9MICO|nr:GTP cyclohydrolase IIa [Promicromonospora iranensis]MDR7381733.1 GTP cyclohydrolase III [Promicromonospora iranensis]
MTHDDQQQVFILVDGDNIGARLEHAIWLDDPAEYVRRSNELTSFFERMGTELTNAGISVLAIGGDSVLAECSTSDIPSVLEVLDKVRARHDVDFSGGLGGTLSQAQTALRIAKTSGKARIHIDPYLI